MLAGLIGVALWPLMILGWTDTYPGPSHARLLVQGFFGGFIFGFLGTSMPRLVGANPLSIREAFLLLAVFLANVLANTLGRHGAADALFLGEIVLWIALLSGRCRSGNDRPPPSFILVGLAFISAAAGTVITQISARGEPDESMDLLGRLLGYHGYVLLCVLGAGGFLLPRFLGLGVRRSFKESAEASPEWRKAFRVAASTGVFILATYGLEAAGHSRIAGLLRTLCIVGYAFYEMPLERLIWNGRGVQWYLITGLVCIPLGVLSASWFTGTRIALSHVELVGGYVLITSGVAARVVFGHSGGREKLERFHPWLTLAGVFMLIGLTTRLTGDFFPKIQASHYFYGAGCWMAGALIWAACVLPRVARPDPEG